MSIANFAALWKALDIALIVGFVTVDFFLFREVFKTGEPLSFAEHLVGVLSVFVILRAIITLKY
jgi:hypothetical protein